MIKNLIFEGGGVKIIGYLGALRVLNENNYLQNVEKYLGSSGGAIIAMLLAVGYSIKELEPLITEKIPLTDKSQCCNGIKSLYGLVCRYGMYKTDKFENWVGDLIYKKTGKSNLTFAELEYTTGNTLVITGSCINQSRLHFYHHKSNPDMEIKKAVRISCSFPFVLEPVIWKGDHLIDGGLLCNYPLSYFDIDALPNTKENINNVIKKEVNPETLGLKLIADGEITNKNYVSIKNVELTNIANYTLGIINTLQSHIENIYISHDHYEHDHDTFYNEFDVNKYWDRTIVIHTGNISTMDVNISDQDKEFLINEGNKGAKKWIENNIP